MGRLLENYFAKNHGTNDTAALAYIAALDHLQEKEPLLASHIIQELKDQRSSLKLIASENYSSLTVQLAMGNLLTDKYAEGHPYHRFYPGCENVDAVEAEAAKRAQELFGADHAYVQPHSGADANLVAFWAILMERVQSKELERLQKKSVDELSPEEYEGVRKLFSEQRLLGLSLSSGGHLTHGFRHNVSGKMMRSFAYDVDPTTHLLDYAKLRTMAQEIKPTILLAGYSAYARKIDFSIMKEIADSVGAVLMVDMAHFAGLVAAKAFTDKFNPIPYADIVTSTTHKTLRGPRGGLILCKRAFAESINKGCPLVLGGPLPHVMAAKAVAFKEAQSESFKEYGKKVIENAQAFAQAFIDEGLRVITGGTDNHLFLVDVSALGLNGRQAEGVLRSVNISANRNMLPYDKNGAWYTSGIRFGTPATTTRGMGVQQMKGIAKTISSLLKHAKPDSSSKTKAVVDINVIEQAKREVGEILKNFPLYPELLIEE